MASNNSLIPFQRSTYDVFVSFRGDTRNNFTDHLFYAFKTRAIYAFKDDTKLHKGKPILSELLQAIEGSQILVVVFSKKYASSKWCLRELERITHYIDVPGKHVLPIFYDVDPSDVRKQGGNYEKAFAKHEERFREDKDTMLEVQRWRQALTQVANLSGWDIRNKPQAAEIEKIVKEIRNILDQNVSSFSDENLVGMEHRIKRLEECLLLGFDDIVRVIGICGMSGIGKTTLVTALYEKIAYQYDFCCFVDDVSKIFRDSGILGVQKQILCQALNEKNLEIDNVSIGTHLVRTRLCRGKRLIVLDNVSDIEQLKKLALNPKCLGAGSRIIIISIDEQILRAYRVDDVYSVKPLNHEDALQLFCINAFKDKYILSDYEKLTFDALRYAEGHPLAIEVLGSSLLGRDVSQWTSALARLRDNPSKNIMDVLRVSVDGLEETEKETFLDIACFLGTNLMKEDSMDYWTEVLDFRGFYPDYGLAVLKSKSLITITVDKQIHMHSMLRELGKRIVREKSPKTPRKWSRVWDCKDLQNVTFDNKAAKDLEAIIIPEFVTTTIMVDAISKMSNLKLLKIDGFFMDTKGGLNNLSNKLGYLTWKSYPFECLPLSFQPDQLVELSLMYGNVVRLWENKKTLHNLRRLNLNWSQNLVEIPDFENAPNLEELDLGGCQKLQQIHPSIGFLRKLRTLDLKDCKSLVKLPCFGKDLILEKLILEGCIQLEHIDPSIGFLRKLITLDLRGCKRLVSLPNSMLGLNCLEYLSLAGCSNLYNIAEHLKKICSAEAPSPSQSTSVMLSHTTDKDSRNCPLPSSPSFPAALVELDLSFCNLRQIPNAIGNMRCLQWLSLRGNHFSKLPSLKKLTNLHHLNLEHCKQLKRFPELPSSPVRSWLDPYESPRRMIGLNAFNCPEIAEKERCINMIVSWMVQLAQAQCRPRAIFPFYRTVENVIPGSEIPRWFDNQHVGIGSTVRIDISPIKHDHDCIGIACCVVFVPHHERGTILQMNPPKTKQSYRKVKHLDISMLLAEDHKSDHMWLFFYTRRELMAFIPDHLNLEIDIKPPVLDRQSYIEVKKYGYRWVHEEDVQLLNSAAIHNRNPSAKKRKLLEIEENK